MIFYYLRLALISIRGNLGPTFLMVAAIGLGVGVAMSIVTVNYLMARDPIPQKSDQLYVVQLDSWSPDNPFQAPDKPPDQLTWTDARALSKADRAFRQVASNRLAVVIQPEDPDIRPYRAIGRATQPDFFPMFDVPFLYGAPWPEVVDEFSPEPVVVLSRKTNDRVFGGENSVGKELEMGGVLYRIVGVIDEWNPVPKFYDLTTGPFDDAEDVYLPWELAISLQLNRSGNTSCWKPVTERGFRAFLGSECVWIQFWAELRTPKERDAYMEFLNNYVNSEKEKGRFPRPLNNRLTLVNDWMDDQEVVQSEAVMMLAVAAMFLVVCLLNTIGLLLAKFMGKNVEVGIRRALGASKTTLFYQYLVETGLIGVSGGLLGLFLTWLGLRGMLNLFGPDAANLMRLDVNMVIATILLAIVSSILAGVYPTWRASGVAPSAQLKSN